MCPLGPDHPPYPQRGHRLPPGDGEFDGITWLSEIEPRGWHDVCRTSLSLLMTAFGYLFPIGVILHQGRGHRPRPWVVLPHAYFTARAYGPVMMMGIWEADHKEPIYLVSNPTSPEEAIAFYQKHPLIETLISDQKERDFHLHASHLYLLERLLLTTVLAYIWVVYLGRDALTSPWRRRLHRTDRCDLSLFQLGMRLLNYCL